MLYAVSERTTKDMEQITTLKPRWSMDMMITRECLHCHHVWVQPATTGRCPKCRSENVTNEDTRVNVLRRL